MNVTIYLFIFSVKLFELKQYVKNYIKYILRMCLYYLSYQCHIHIFE